MWRLNSYTQVLHCNVRNGRSSIEEQRTVAEPVKGLEEILLDNFKLDRTTKIGILASPMVRQALKTFLKEN